MNEAPGGKLILWWLGLPVCGRSLGGIRGLRLGLCSPRRSIPCIRRIDSRDLRSASCAVLWEPRRRKPSCFFRCACTSCNTSSNHRYVFVALIARTNHPLELVRWRLIGRLVVVGLLLLVRVLAGLRLRIFIWCRFGVVAWRAIAGRLPFFLDAQLC